MKTENFFIPFFSVLMATPAFAHLNEVTHRPESHAPAGVMGDHLHKQGEWMLGIRTLSRDFSDLYQGSDKIAPQQAAEAGFSMYATEMRMDMIMLDIMYALNDNVTLMFMPQYMKMDMTMAATPGMMNEMHETDGMAEMDGMGEHSDHGMHHQHDVSGIGDTLIGALIRIAKNGNHSVHATLNISVPTGSVDERNADGTFVHYGMQLGSGTWDLHPGLTYTGYDNLLSWGAQLGTVLRLEDENDSGFAFGERYFATGWGAYRFADWGSTSLRLSYEKENKIRGHYNDTHNHSSPPDFQHNYGGEFVDAGIGLNVVPQTGALAGVRLGLEWVLPVRGHYNGIQLGRDTGWNLSLTYAL